MLVYGSANHEIFTKETQLLQQNDLTLTFSLNLFYLHTTQASINNVNIMKFIIRNKFLKVLTDY